MTDDAPPLTTIRQDSWDRLDFDATIDDTPPMAAAVDKLTEVSRLGRELGADVFAALHKHAPRRLDEVAPEAAVNAAIVDEVLQAPSYLDLHRMVAGDRVGAGLAVNAMQDQLVDLNDRLAPVQEAADAAQAARDAHLEALERALAGDPGDDGEPPPAPEEVQELAEAAEAAQAGLDAAISEAGPSIGRAVRAAVAAAEADAADTAGVAAGWGLKPGTLAAMDPADRFALMGRLRTDFMRRVTALFGRFRAVAFGAKQHRWHLGPDQIHDIILTGDLDRVLPSELGALAIPELEDDFYVRLVEAQLLGYELRTHIKAGRGPIVYGEDSSGSMSIGDRLVWAKAIGLTLASIATAEGREFRAVMFGGPGLVREFTVDVNDPMSMVAYAEAFLSDAGTDFVGPLERAVDIIRNDEHMVDADIVFATDGLCQVPPGWADRFTHAKADLGCRVWSFCIGTAASPALVAVSDRLVELTDDLVSDDTDVSTLFTDVTTRSVTA